MRLYSACLGRALLALTMVMAGAVAVSRAQNMQEPATAAVPTSVRQADAACSRCHAAIYDTYVKTPKAKASGLATENLVSGSWTQPASGVNYRVEKTGDTAWLRYSDSRDQFLQGEHPLEYFLGSGHLAVTYLYSASGYLLESPVAYYSGVSHYDMKPGLEDLHEAAPAIPMEPSCLRCHMSGVEQADAGSENHYSSLPFLHGGITCESCHGDTAEHVRSGGKVAVLNPAKLTPQRRDSICLSCHLEGDISIEKKGRTLLDFKPGDDIAQYVSFFVYAKADPNARGVSEVEQFATSHCKRASGDAMSCTTCHDPHRTPSATERVSFYRNKCLSCHNTGTFAATHHPENPDCTSCHMPRSTAQNIPHVAWTDHRILARPLAEASTASDFSTLLPVFSPAATPRDHALALYSSVMEGHRQNRDQALEQLTAASASDDSDVQVLSALGALATMDGNMARAASLFHSVLAIEPADRTAAVNLAVIDARSGDLQGARTLLQPVFERNQDSPAIAMNLAAIDCREGDSDAARAVLQTALRFSPGSSDLRMRLQESGSCTAQTR